MRKLSILMVVGALLFGASASFAQQSVTLEDVSPVWYFQGQPVLPVGQDVTLRLRVTNINGMDYSYNPTLLFTVSSADGATWDTTEIAYSSTIADQFVIAFSYTDTNMTPQHFTTGSDADSVGLAFVAFSPPALYDGFDDVAVTIVIRPELSAAGTHLRLDAVQDLESSAAWGWIFYSLGFSPDVAPSWGGPYDFLISPAPCGAPEMSVENNPTEIRGSYCESLSANFVADWSVVGECTGDMQYAIVDGPGTIDPMTGAWSWDVGADQGDLGQTVPLVIEACSDGVCSRSTFQVTPTFGVPQFTTGCDETIQVEKGRVADLQFAVDGLCPDAPLEYFVSDDGGAGGYYYFVDGHLRWDTYFASSGTYSWQIGATTGPDTSYCSIDVQVTTCCGTYTGGFTGNIDCSADGKINLADITKLVDRVYLSKELACCEANANVDGDDQYKINLADITRLIDHVYLSKDPTAPCQ